jgi:hypothetical protein
LEARLWDLYVVEVVSMRRGVLVYAAACILAVIACGSTVPKTDAGAGVCHGDPTDQCAVCRCTSCGPVTGACQADATCVTAEAAFNSCAARAPGTDAASLAPCRDAANQSSAKAGPYLDCLIASCADKCL